MARQHIRMKQHLTRRVVAFSAQIAIVVLDSLRALKVVLVDEHARVMLDFENTRRLLTRCKTICNLRIVEKILSLFGTEHRILMIIIKAAGRPELTSNGSFGFGGFRSELSRYA